MLQELHDKEQMKGFGKPQPFVMARATLHVDDSKAVKWSTPVMLDTGAQVSVVATNFLQRYEQALVRGTKNAQRFVTPFTRTEVNETHLRGAFVQTGALADQVVQLSFELTLKDGTSANFTHEFYEVESVFVPMIIGIDLLDRYLIPLHYSNRKRGDLPRWTKKPRDPEDLVEQDPGDPPTVTFVAGVNGTEPESTNASPTLAEKSSIATGSQRNKNQCEFAQPRVAVLRHDIGTIKVHITGDTRKNILDFPRPRPKKDIQSFLGLTDWDRRFVPHVANYTAPLETQPRKNIRLSWHPGGRILSRPRPPQPTTPPTPPNTTWTAEILEETEAPPRTSASGGIMQPLTAAGAVAGDAEAKITTPTPSGEGKEAAVSPQT